MKNHISAMAAGLAMLSLASCSKDTEGLTGITYYPVIEMEGPVYDQIETGVAYEDPGYSAMLNGEDYTSEVEVITDLDFSNPQPGFYTILYSAVNADGFTTTCTRYVLVTDADDPVSGYYTVSEDSYRDYNGITYYGGFQEVIYGNGDGTYHVSDLLAGWYEFRAGYGSSYAMQGEIEVADDGTVTLLDSYVPGWRDEANYLEDGTFDEATGTLKYVVSYTDYPFLFNVTMEKNQ